jgi:hypothetical protein
MRRFALVALSLPLLVVTIYACSEDSTSSSPSVPDSGTTTPTSTSTSTNTPPGDSSTPPVDGGADTAQPFTPAALGGRLVLWLDADRGYDLVDGGVVWKDQSPEGNHAIQDTPARQPQRIDGGVLDAGNRGVVRFAGNQYLSIADDTSLQWGAGDYAIFAVVRHTNNPSSGNPYAIVYAKWIDTAPYTGPFVFANYPETVTSGYVSRVDDSREARTDGGLNDGVLRLVGTRKLGNDLELRINGTKQDQIDAGGYDTAAFSAFDASAVIGGRAAANFQALEGDIAELIAVKGSLSDAEQTNIEVYLKARHGL